MEKFLEYLSESKRIIKTCDHMIYVSFPLIKDKRIIIKVLIELKKSLAFIINAILQFEYIYKRIKLSKNAKTNLQTFINKSAIRFNIEKEEIKKILYLFEIVELHKASAMVFPKEDKIVILSENMNKEIITSEKIKEFLILSKNILKKTEEKLKSYH